MNLEYHKIGEIVLKKMNEEARGHILNLTSKSIYFELDDGTLILLCSVRYGYIPFAILVDDFELQDIKTLLLRQESSAFYLTKDGIFFDSFFIKIMKLKKEEVSEFNKTVVRRFEVFVEAFIKSSVPDCKEALLKLIGLGEGLTPCADDMLMGFLYGCMHLEKPSDFRGSILNLVKEISKEQTSKISCQYISSVCDGMYFEILDNLLLAYLYEKDISIHKDRLNIVGNSSGPYMARGMEMYLRSTGIFGKEE